MKKALHTGIFWYWNDDPSPAGIRRQLKEIAAAGFECVYLHPMPEKFRPHAYFTGMKIPYLGERYFELARVMLEECRRLGLFMMLYDEGGWPSGSALGMVTEDPSCCARFLVRTPVGSYVEETRHVPDLLDPRVTRRFIKLTHERYRAAFGDEFGKTIRGIFTDEPYYNFHVGVEEVRIARGMEARIRKKFGCDLRRDLLPFLYSGCGEKPGAGRARRIYLAVASEMFAENYTGVVARWCRKHHLDFEGHFDKEESLFETGFAGDIYEYLTAMDVPGVDAIWRLIHPETGTGRLHYPVMASSAAIRLDRKETLAECFNVYGYDLTTTSMNYVANALFVQGINRILPMPYLYSDAGPHKVCCSTDVSPRVPQWHAMKALNEAWQQAADFDAGALKPRVWVCWHPELPPPDNPYSPSKPHAAAGDRVEALLDRLDRAGIFWRFANLRDVQTKELPEILLYPSQPEAWELSEIEKCLAGTSVRMLNGWEDALASYGELDLLEPTTPCMLRPCLRREGEALMVFNPTAEAVTLRFKATSLWSDVTPDKALAALQPFTLKEGVGALPVPAGALRILLKNGAPQPPQEFEPLALKLPWFVTEIEKMEMHADPPTCFRRETCRRKFPADGVWKESDFSGTLTLQAEVTLDAPVSGYLAFDHVGSSAILRVNNARAVSRAFGPWAFPVKLKAGKNLLVLKVSTTAGNEWKRCTREEMLPRGWVNPYWKTIFNYAGEDPRPGVSPQATLWKRVARDLRKGGGSHHGY